MIEDICTQPWDHAPPLLASRKFNILAESGRQHLVGTRGVMETLWEELRHGSAFARKGSKVSLNRFISLAREGLEELSKWSLRKTCYEAVALELDMVGVRSSRR